MIIAAKVVLTLASLYLAAVAGNGAAKDSNEDAVRLVLGCSVLCGLVAAFL